jgi:hypothetical protein
MWRDAQADLAPAKSIARINDNAKFLAGSVTLVGSIFTSVGLISIDRFRVNGVAAALGGIAALLATLAVLVAIGSLVLRVRSIQIANLADVRSWYMSQLHKGIVLAGAGWVLVASIVLGACATFIVLVTPPNPSLSLQLSGQGSTSTLSAKTSLQGLTPGTRVETQVAGENSGSSPVPLAISVTTADVNGKADVSIDLPQPGDYAAFKLSVVVRGSPSASLEIVRKK